jgi:TolA-binding protein
MPQQLAAAHGLFRQRKFDMAAEEYRRFLEKEEEGPDADDARFGLASAWLYQGKYKEAKAGFEDFLSRAPRHARARTARYRLGELAYMLGDLAAARRELETFVAGPPGHANLETGWTYLGDVCLGLDDLPAARRAYDRALAEFPRGQLADRTRYGLGRTLSGLGEAEAALKVLGELARGGRSDWVDRAWLQIARIHSTGGNPAAVIESLDALDRTSPKSARSAEAVVLRAEALARLDRKPAARKLLEPIAADPAQPLAPRAALGIATIQLEDASPEQALGTLEGAIKRSPGSPLEPALLFRAAEALQKLNRLAEAGERFLRVAQLDPPDPASADAAVRAAQLALDTGESARAGELAETFAKRFAGSGKEHELRLILARSLMAGGKPREAAGMLEELLGLNQAAGPAGKPKAESLPASAQTAARYDLALAYRAAGQPAQAERMLAALAGAGKGTAGANARFLIGQAHVEAGRFAEAVEPLNEYLAASPRGDVADYALADLAIARLGLGDRDEARKAVEQLASRFPRSKVLASTRLRLAEAALDAGQAEEAAAQFRVVLGLDPEGKEIPESAPAATEDVVLLRGLAGLGRALWKLGKPGLAADMFGRFLDASADHPMAPQVALDRAAALEDAGKIDDALAAYSQVDGRYPRADQALRARLLRARLLARTGHPDLAVTDLMMLLFDRARRTRLAAMGETTDGLLAELGWTLADSRQFEEADRIFTALLESYPESPRATEARFNLAESANQARNFAEVVRLLSPLAKGPRPDEAADRSRSKPRGPALEPAKESPRIPEGPREAGSRLMPLILYRLGRAQLELGDWPAGAASLDRLIAEYPSSPRLREARFLRGEAALRQDDASAAESVFAAILKEPAGPDDPEGFAALVRGRHVQSLLGLRRWKEALAEADSLKDGLPVGDPAGAELEFARGRALLGLARPEDARNAFQAVIDARKEGDLAAQAQLMRGETFFHQERFREALREYLMVEFLFDAPESWQAAAMLEAGKAYERLSEWNDAAEMYERLRSRFPQDPHAAQAGDRLSAVRKKIPTHAGAGDKAF